MATQIFKNQTGRAPEVNQLDLGAQARPSNGCQNDAAATEQDATTLRQQAARLSQQASMAEVATTALHNVGNVLNSVNVSASVVSQRLRESRVHNIGKALTLLREHRADLARFLTDDPKGRMLPGYLETLAEHLAAEHAELLRETEALTRSLEHIKEIVAVQQSYARKCGSLETLPAAELVEDALRMNSAAFERHGVKIVREFMTSPSITVDKHKVLQILVNLIRNAKYALDELGGPQKVLTLGIHPKNEDALTISVQDNGIGIPQENLNRIFEQGFTTRREGHGFGLYSGLMTATELGGRLTAQSDGIGKGALFSLELPLVQKPLDHDNARGNNNNPRRC